MIALVLDVTVIILLISHKTQIVDTVTNSTEFKDEFKNLKDNSTYNKVVAIQTNFKCCGYTR